MWVFGYGSLMWDGWEQPFGGVRVDRAVLNGYRRSFNKRSIKNWGTSEAPAPTLGLEPGVDVNCTGTAFEFPDGQRAAIEELLTEREGKSFAFPELSVRLPDGRVIRALTPVNDREGRTYIGNVELAQRASMARTAVGTSGPCVEYVRNIHKKLTALGIVDTDVDEFLALLQQLVPVSDMSIANQRSKNVEPLK
jgi:glutathione-specific gamma-glutamylcyclotransferase